MPPSIRPLIPTLVVCALVTLLLCQHHAGFMLVALALPLVPWLIYSAWVVATKPVVRKQQLVKACIWMLGVSIVLSAHAIMFTTAQRSAEEISAALETHIRKFGQCPKELEAVGLNKAALRKKLGYAAYSCESGKPTLFYGSTFVPFETENYDFSNHAWVHVSD